MPRPASSPARVARAIRLGRTVRRMREEATMSREQLARAAGVSTETLRKIEQGSTTSPELFTFAALMEQLGGSIDDTLRAIARDLD